MRYSEMPEKERPPNRIREYGPQAMTDAELLATALFLKNSLAAQEIAARMREVGGLAKLRPDQLTDIEGVGGGTATSIMAIGELCRRGHFSIDNQRAVVQSPGDVYNFVVANTGIMSDEQENLLVLILNTKNAIVRLVKLYRGQAAEIPIRVAEVFKDAVRENASSVILVHNHPSGDPTPSPEDVAVTKSIIKGGEALEIKVLDHIIIGGGRFNSMKAKGLMR